MLSQGLSLDVSGETGTGYSLGEQFLPHPPWEPIREPQAAEVCMAEGGMLGGRASFLYSVPSESLTSIILTGLTLPHSPLRIEVQLFPIPYDLFVPIARLCLSSPYSQGSPSCYLLFAFPPPISQIPNHCLVLAPGLSGEQIPALAV